MATALNPFNKSNGEVTWGPSNKGGKVSRKFRIHGDNVVECERTLQLLEEGLGQKPILISNSSPLHPEFEYKLANGESYIFELLPGHGRWGIDISNGLVTAGSQLRENADSVITELSGDSEIILIGIEYCGALPAGNQAWQRHGRALGFAQAGVPYLIFTEVGGMELTSERESIASRLPNPASTYALLQMTHDLGTVVLPVYEAAPSAPPAVREKFLEAFGHNDAVKIISGAVSQIDTKLYSDVLAKKTLRMVEILATLRTRNDALNESEWERVLTSIDRFNTLGNLSSKYVRRSTDKVQSSKTMSKFAEAASKVGSLEFFSGSLPMTWIPKSIVPAFVRELEKVYGSNQKFNQIEQGKKNVVIIFVTGFKPKGEDSRPDRGLMPLGRMLTGPDDLVVTFLWGPAKATMLQKMALNYEEVAKSNGLVEAAVSVSDFVLVDSINYPPFLIDSRKTLSVRSKLPRMKNELTAPDINEHDVDSIIHFLVTQPKRDGYFEGMCNPPGGDWSGISLQQSDDSEIRWTSLPRVSNSSAKRPDHIIQFRLPKLDFILAVESKLVASKMDAGVGPNLIRYISDLAQVAPNVTRKSSKDIWDSSKVTTKFRLSAPVYSAATFRLLKKSELREVLTSSGANLVVGLEFEYEGDIVNIHLLSQKGFEFLSDAFTHLAETSSFGVKVHK